MGDRGNVVIYQDEKRTPIVFYTHWGGTELREDVIEAIASAQDRWKDRAYLARIIFEGIKEAEVPDNLGFGISTEIQDNEHAIVVVDVPAQRVRILNEPPTSEPWAYGALGNLELEGWDFSELEEMIK